MKLEAANVPIEQKPADVQPERVQPNRPGTDLIVLGS
jgi:hypothetical protein